MSYEYKTVGAPERGKRRRGARSQSDRVAAAFEELLQDEAVDAWEYLRTDLLPVNERSGWFGKNHEVHRAVMVFRRPLDQTEIESDAVLRRAPSVAPPPPLPERAPRLEPEIRDDPDLRIADLVRGPGNPKPQH